jgi:hypothetical protein
LEQESVDETGADDAGNQARDNTDAKENGSLTEDELENIAAVCANGHADPDLPSALGDGVGEDAECADGGEEERDECERDEKRGRHTLSRDGVRQNIPDGFDMIDRLGRIGREDGVAD